jgi:hypothetical protein
MTSVASSRSPDFFCHKQSAGGVYCLKCAFHLPSERQTVGPGGRGSAKNTPEERAGKAATKEREPLLTCLLFFRRTFPNVFFAAARA